MKTFNSLRKQYWDAIEAYMDGRIDETELVKISNEVRAQFFVSAEHNCCLSCKRQRCPLLDMLNDEDDFITTCSFYTVG